MEKPFYQDPSDEPHHHWIIIGIFIAVVLVVLGIGLRIYEYVILRYATEQQAAPTVSVLQAKPGPATEDIVLPANVEAWHAATIYARVNGYVINWLVDIGSRVKKDDLLATISAPEVDAQLRQTEADLKTAEANNVLAQITAKRWKNLLKTDSVSKQETDATVSTAAADEAIVASTRANRDRLRDLVSFEKIIAPFDGIISSRTTDIGKLINAGSSGTVPLFRIVQADRLRVYVNIPQYYSVNLTPGLTTKLYFREHPGKIFIAKLLDSANAINPNSRTLLIQLIIDNKDYTLLPGSYSEVHLILPAKNNMQLPVSSLIFRAQGTQVAILDKESKAVLKPITIGRIFSDNIEVASGIKPGETVILNPPADVFEGQKLRVATSNSSAKGG